MITCRMCDLEISGIQRVIFDPQGGAFEHDSRLFPNLVHAEHLTRLAPTPAGPVNTDTGELVEYLDF